MDTARHPHLVLEMKIEPKSQGDAARLLAAITLLARQDLTFGYSQDPASGELLVASVSEDQLEAQLETLRRVSGIEFLLGAPQVRYKETIRRAVEHDYTHKKLAGGVGEFARVKLRLEPSEPGRGNEFASEIIGGVVPEEFIPGVESGVRSVWRAGPLIGVPMVDMKVTLFDGAYHEVDSSNIAFEMASRQCMREACAKAGIMLLEPIMDVEVVTPGDFIGGVIGDINGRRGQIRGQEMRGTDTVLRAYVPMDCMFGYASSLRSSTKGRSTFGMHFSHYEEVRRRDDGPDDFPPAVGMRA